MWVEARKGLKAGIETIVKCEMEKLTLHSEVDKADIFAEFAQKELIATLKGFNDYAKRRC